jgi:hypothetical protein
LTCSQRVALDGALHGDATVEHDVYQGRNGQNVSNGRKSGVLSETVAGEGTVLLNEALHPHILEGSFLGYNKRDLSELRGKQETGEVVERVLGGVGRCQQRGAVDV